MLMQRGRYAHMYCGAGVHYEQSEGVLVFDSGEKEKDIKIRILNGEVDKQFHVFLCDTEVATLSKKRAACDVHFVADKKFGIVMSMVQSIIRRQDNDTSSGGPWIEQFKEAIIPGGRVTEDGEGEELEASDYILHIVSFSWKVRDWLTWAECWLNISPCTMGASSSYFSFHFRRVFSATKLRRLRLFTVTL